MKVSHIIIVALISSLFTAGGMVLIFKPPSNSGGMESGAQVGSDQRKIIYWKAPMDPREIYHGPGKSKMGMDLVPVYEDEVSGSPVGDSQVDGVDVSINPVVEQNMGLRVEAVAWGPLNHTIRTFGHITYDETRKGRISPRFEGWVETLFADYTGIVVKKGDPLFTAYSPALTASQEEFLAAKKNYGARRTAFNKGVYQSARKRLEYYGMDGSDVERLEKEGRVMENILFRSPFAGVVVEKKGVEGGYFKAGTDLFTIVDLSVVWVEAHIFEYEQNRVRIGQEVEMELPYDPGKIYKGKIAYIYPYLQPKTRDVVIRLAFDNANGMLRPDMYARIKIRSDDNLEGLSIPSQAVIHSGEDKIVFMARGEGRFSPRKITTGLHLEGGRLQVLSGLAAGENIVVSGQFLLDSESKLKEAIQKMMELGSPSRADQDFFDDMDDNAFNEDDFFDDEAFNDVEFSKGME